VIPIILLTALLVTAEEDAPPEAQVNLNVELRVGIPQHVSLESDYDGNVTISMPTGPQDRRLTVRRSLRLSDEFTDLSDGGWRAERTIRRWHREQDGEIDDPEINGVVLDYAQEGSQGGVTSEGSRKVSEPTLQKMMDVIGSIGFTLDLPIDARMNTPFELDFKRLAPVLLGLSGEVSGARGVVQLEQVDARGVALSRGKLVVTERQEDGGIRVDSRYDGDLTLEVDTIAHRVTRLTWSGKSSSAGGDGPVGIDARGRFSVEFESSLELDDEPAESKPAAFRPVARQLEGLGVSLTLASHWFPVSTEAGAGFVSSLHGERDSRAYIEVFRIDVPEDQLEEAYARARQSVLGEDDPEMLTAVTAPIGAGVSRIVDAEAIRTYVEIYPLANALVRVRVQGNGAAFDEARAEYESIRETLRQS